MTDLEKRMLLKKKYYDFFENVTFYPTIKDISIFFDKPEIEVSMDIKDLRLVNRYTRLKKLLARLLSRKETYQNYYYSDLHYDTKRMAKIFGTSEYEVLKDIEELNRRFFGTNNLGGLSDIVVEKPISIVNKELLQIRLLDLFKKLDYIPSEKEFINMLDIECSNFTLLVSELGLLTEYLSFINLKSFFNRYATYKKYYFDLKYFYTMEQMAEILGITTSDVSKDIRFIAERYGLVRPNKTELSRDVGTLSKTVEVNGVAYTFDDRKKLYEEVIDKFGYIPYKRIVSEETGIDKQTVSDDFLALKLTPVSQTWWYKNVYLREETLKHLDVYKKYFFDTDTPLNRDEIADIIGICHVTVSKELVYARDYLGCKKKVSLKIKNRVETEDFIKTQKEIERKKPISKRDTKYFNPIEANSIERGNYYRINHLESFTPMTYEKMASDLGIGFQSVFRGVHKVKNDENAGIKRLHKNKKGHFICTDFELRNQNYKLYFDKYGSVKNLKELAEKLHLGFSVVSKDFAENDLYKIYKVDFYESRHKTDNTSLKKGTAFSDRYKMYKEYFDKNKSVKSIGALSGILNLPKTTVADDFDKYNLYTKFSIESVTSNKDFENRYNSYLKYYARKKKKIESIEKMASDLKLRVMTVYSDFSRNNLYKEFNVKCKSAE